MFLFKNGDGYEAPPHFSRMVTECLNANCQRTCIGRGDQLPGRLSHRTWPSLTLFVVSYK